MAHGWENREFACDNWYVWVRHMDDDTPGVMWQNRCDCYASLSTARPQGEERAVEQSEMQGSKTQQTF